MALVTGDEVAIAQSPANVSYYQRNGDFQFGVIVDAAGVDVVWANGTRADGIGGAQLDKIEAVTNALGGKVVSFGSNVSPEYYGVVVRIYARDPNDSGAPVSYALIRLLSSGQLVEALLSTVEEVQSR